VWLGAPSKHTPVQQATGSDEAFEIALSNETYSSPTTGLKSACRDNSVRPFVLLTGATGFVGAQMWKKLLEQYGRIRILALPETVKDIPRSDRIKIVEGNLTEEEGLATALRGVETVFHLAALLPGSSYVDLMRVNVHGTENLLRACGRAEGVRRFVFLSSVAAYGGPFRERNWPYTENSPLCPGGSQSSRNYGHSKVAAESLVRRYASDYGFEYVILRASTCYGRGGKFVKDLIRQVLDDPAAGYRAAGTMVLQLVHVKDLVNVVCQVGVDPRAKNEIFNIAGIEGPNYRYVAN